MVRIFLLLLAIVPALMAQAPAFNSEFLVRVWQTEEGLPGNVVRSLGQTSDGFLWIATAEGFARFDGREFEPIIPDGKDHGTQPGFFRIFTPADDSVWVSTYLLKRSTTADVRDAIAGVLTGGAPMSAEIARRIVDAFHQSPVECGGESDLSPREIEILEQLCEGLANKEIADRLGISFETVRVHLKNIFEKLHVRSRTEAAMKYRNSLDPGNWLR